MVTAATDTHFKQCFCFIVFPFHCVTQKMKSLKLCLQNNITNGNTVPSDYNI